VQVSLAQAADHDALDAYARTNARTSHYHLSGWRQLVEEVFGHATYCVQARDGAGQVCGLLPLVRLRSRMFGDYMVSVPYVNYGGAIAADTHIERQLMDSAASLAAELGVSHVEFRDVAKRDGPYVLRTDKVVMVRELPADVDELWREVGAKVRAQVRRPSREGAVVVRGGGELLGDFYQVFARNMRDLGTPVYGREFFSAILRRFPAATSLTVVRLAGRPVAAAFLLRDRSRIEVPWASSLREHNASGVNMLLYWSLLEQAVQSGCREFDFGRSSRDSGTWRFKKQWGAQERPLYWHYWLAPGRPIPGLRTDNPKFALAIRLWQRLPVAVANLIGPSIVKNLP
jgi:FemAB-related protein (PEP-CTERM system-associated)